MVRLGRIVVWCDSKSTVCKSFAFFCEALGLRAGIHPKLRTNRDHLPQFRESFCASVHDGNVAIEFASVGWVEKVRSLTRCSPAAQVVAICLENVEKEDALNRRPSGSESLLYMQQFAWLNSPLVQPFVLGVEPSKEGRRRDKSFDVNASHLKELVFGEDESRFYGTSAHISAIAPKTVVPGALSFVQSESYQELVPILRVLPSQVTSFVFKVGSLDRMKRDVLNENDDILWSERQERGFSAAQVRVEAPFLHGLDIRVTASEEFERYFIETPQSQIRAVDFGRDDMGSMSCASVSGMEMKERGKRMPKQILTSLGRKMRPKFQV